MMQSLTSINMLRRAPALAARHEPGWTGDENVAAVVDALLGC
ncbi:MAG: hypothetical protein SGI88_01380 [Candidatus Hydrogenedentes bacterium]|nr:hypothetical protein [Candidatus Hydrogenedentota bacterium]